MEMGQLLPGTRDTTLKILQAPPLKNTLVLRASGEGLKSGSLAFVPMKKAFLSLDVPQVSPQEMSLQTAVAQ